MCWSWTRKKSKKPPPSPYGGKKKQKKNTIVSCSALIKQKFMFCVHSGHREWDRESTELKWNSPNELNQDEPRRTDAAGYGVTLVGCRFLFSFCVCTLTNLPILWRVFYSLLFLCSLSLPPPVFPDVKRQFRFGATKEREIDSHCLDFWEACVVLELLVSQTMNYNSFNYNYNQILLHQHTPTCIHKSKLCKELCLY